MITPVQFFTELASDILMQAEASFPEEVAEQICDHVGDWERANKVECPECEGTGRVNDHLPRYTMCRNCVGLGRVVDE